MDNKTKQLFLKAYKEKEKMTDEFFKKHYNVDIKFETEYFIKIVWNDLLEKWQSIENYMTDLNEFELEFKINKTSEVAKTYNAILKTNVITLDNGYNVIYSKLTETFLNEKIKVYINSEENTLVIETTRKHIDELMDEAVRKLSK